MCHPSLILLALSNELKSLVNPSIPIDRVSLWLCVKRPIKTEIHSQFNN